ncbi:unnamed protein product [Moneuplotes crassus]|uniref:Origin recognition complex subunit 3 N-terminal domain-containing protein n=1 Tax=Euplotes crassus TaxID=5936 RepID=A0AAD1Y8G9_EUPCR|nr:unnamed protein product [Moneuplotes crassus]
MNNTEYEYNRSCIVLNPSQRKGQPKQNFRRDFIKIVRKSQFLKYNKFFENEINSTVLNNNREIYENCAEFIKQHCIRSFSKDVPTNIVITNCESSANNDTQFSSLFDELKRKHILSFVIDEKKCGTTKNMISYIQKGVADLFGHEINIAAEDSEEIMPVISSDGSSIDENENEEEEDKDGVELHYISPRIRRTIQEYEPKAEVNEKTAKEYEIGRTTISDYSKKRERLIDDYNGDIDADGNTLAVDKIGFSGVKKIIKNAECTLPIVIVIQNIKTFPTENLNDLIYLIKKYRAKHNLKLCLMIGVKSNSFEDLMSKISITTSNLLIVKKYYFPSIKRILLEVIYRLLKSRRNCYIFGTKFLNSIVENIQVYGLSLEKFKRIMHFLIAHHFRTNKYFFINGMIDDSKEIMKLDQMKSAQQDKECLDSIIKQFEAQNENIREIKNCITNINKCTVDTIDTEPEVLKYVLVDFYHKKLKYFKAYDLLEDLCLNFLPQMSEEDKNIFKNCFLLNLFSCKTKEQRIGCVLEELNVADWEEVVNWLETNISTKKSEFLIESANFLQEKIREVKTFGLHITGKSKSNHRRKGMLSKNNRENGDQPVEESKLDSEDYKNIFKKWLRHFVHEYVSLNLDEIQKEAFILENSQITERICPDIQGNMAKSIMQSSKCIFSNFMANFKIKSKEKLVRSKEEYLHHFEKDTTKLMEGYRMFGKDIDINEWFMLFCDKVRDEEDIPKTKDSKRVLSERFLKALGDLKFMGFISESGRGTYIFKRNYFGKNYLKL